MAPNGGHGTRPPWGVMLELKFGDEEARNAFRELPALTAALDAVPDPVFGLLVYPGRGGASGAGKTRRPRLFRRLAPLRWRYLRTSSSTWRATRVRLLIRCR